MIFKKLLILSLLICSVSFADNGLITLKSNHSVKETVKQLKQALNAKGMTIFDTINHKKGAKGVGKKLRPTTVVIFGNPKIGTSLMHCSQTMAIDLPQKALIWKDADGNVWYSYNDPSYLAQRHNIKGCEMVLNKVTNALANFAKVATN
jgi:uncharacterized protein (DUF302 family)